MRNRAIDNTAFRGGQRFRAIAASPWAALAFLLRVAVSAQRPRLSFVEPQQRTSPPRSRADGRRLETYRRLDRRTCTARIPQRRTGQALQRSAEAQLSFRR